ncbi:MAG: tRNA epoxyqueuosine(34) reductase QueG [Polyangiaceae bacterium]|nr:tRNA epoxyqueuosine(34) reductase QueG [Polyangiaceae bacterium]
MLAPESADQTRWATEIAEAALRLGFTRVGFAPAEGRFERGSAALKRWLDAGLHGEMHFLSSEGDRAHPQTLLGSAKTLVVVALAYPGSSLVELRKHGASPARTGYIAGYARGPDYHTVMRSKLVALGKACTEIVGRPLATRGCVDTAPLLEREASWFAGIGFTGKNTLSIAPGLGSNFLLGELLLDVELPPSLPRSEGCGRCRSCLDACPTQAFVSDYVLDARRCISYLTIEYRGVIPQELRPLMGNHVFGCDICQAVCPYNARAESREHGQELAPKPGFELPDLVELLELTSTGYRRFAKKSARRRANRATLARNAAVALGNSGDPSAQGPLEHALCSHPFALVRGHAAWALGELGPVLEVKRAVDALEAGKTEEPEAWVRDEMGSALARLR